MKGVYYIDKLIRMHPGAAAVHAMKEWRYSFMS